MATIFKPYEKAGKFGIYYLFEKAGDGIAMHSHLHKSVQHNTVCLTGSVVIYGDSMDLILTGGDTAHFKSYRQHEIVALVAGTQIVNMFLYGRPEGHELMQGCIESELMGRVIFGGADDGRYNAEIGYPGELKADADTGRADSEGISGDSLQTGAAGSGVDSKSVPGSGREAR